MTDFANQTQNGLYPNPEQAEIANLAAKLQAAEDEMAQLRQGHEVDRWKLEYRHELDRHQKTYAKLQAAEAQNKELAERLCTESRCTDQFIEENDALRSRAEAAEAEVARLEGHLEAAGIAAKFSQENGAKLRTRIAELEAGISSHFSSIGPPLDKIRMEATEAALRWGWDFPWDTAKGKTDYIERGIKALLDGRGE